MTTFEIQNISADKFANAHIPIMNEVVEPLRALNITHFSYNRLVGNDKALLLCPEISMLREEFGRSLDILVVQPQLEQIQQQREFLFWQSFCTKNIVLEKLREHNINHGFTLFRKVEEDVHETFHFATTNDNEQIQNYYHKNLSLLNLFSDYFVDKMSDIIDHKIPGKLIHFHLPK